MHSGCTLGFKQLILADFVLLLLDWIEGTLLVKSGGQVILGSTFRDFRGQQASDIITGGCGIIVTAPSE